MKYEESYMVDIKEILNEKHLTPAELNSLTEGILKLSAKIESFKKNDNVD